MPNYLTEFFRRGGVTDPFETMRRDMERMFTERFPALGATFGGTEFAPALDVRTTDAGLEVTAELPGVTESDITLEIQDDVLTLKGEKKEEREEKAPSGAILRERSYGSFSRSVRLPYAPEPDKVTAKFDKGVLHVTAPKPAEIAEKTRRIPIG
ncbi:MAG TPA: Hsp20/alpha crystallin family protein [Paracoccaceae bacterium]|nr:Hsp20/alpha crystallin family protein [Paracoccaceae bacterium]